MAMSRGPDSRTLQANHRLRADTQVRPYEKIAVCLHETAANVPYPVILKGVERPENLINSRK